MASIILSASSEAQREYKLFAWIGEKHLGKYKKKQINNLKYAAIEITKYYYMALRATIWALQLEEHVSMK